MCMILKTALPKIVNFTAGLQMRFVGDVITAECCVEGYPELIISINGHPATPTSWSGQSNNLFRGCATRNIPTLHVTANSNFTSSCSVAPAVFCNAQRGNRAPEQASYNCSSAPQKWKAYAALTTLIIGKLHFSHSLSHSPVQA